MYITTRMINPHFSPELCAQVAVINFAVTMAGLEQQLLRRVVMPEQLELEEQRLRLVEEVPTNLKTLSPRTYTTSSAVGFLPSLTPLFAIGLLHMSIKVTNEAPAGIRAGLNGTYAWLTQDNLDAISGTSNATWRQDALHTLLHAHCRPGVAAAARMYGFTRF